MDSILWGVIVLLCGIFIAAYGHQLFRLALAFIGFALGVYLVMWLGGGLDAGLRIVVAIIVGGILAAVLYFLVKFALYVAGGVMGLVLMLAILGLFRLGGLDLGLFGSILALAGAGLGGFFGRRLGPLVTVFATSLAGAYFVVLGLGALFGLGVATDDPTVTLGAAFPLVLFLTIAAISGLAQYQAFVLRQRFLRR
ncbi:MAG: DUF4203 domain-containing protein [Candidatus Promineofilum sp.]|nr:DUF4203 domain-containing protein [Promineifilum sp.]MCW5863463.1 DUF4203 domain-containing protein [Anaerolineae bacterium]